MENQLYPYSPIVRRPRIEWPNGARVAFWVGLNSSPTRSINR